MSWKKAPHWKEACCDICRFSISGEGHAGSTWLECHRHAPQVWRDREGCWPHVGGMDWCAEFEAQQELL